MTAFLLAVLKLLGIVLLLSLLLVLILMLIPLRLHFKYLDGFTLSLNYSFLKYSIIPKQEKDKKKEKKEKKPEKEKPPREKSKKEKGKRPLRETLDTVIKILKDLKPAFKRFFKKIKISGLKLEIMVSEGDAAKTGENFVKVNDAVLCILNLLDKIFTVKAEEIYIYPDFKEEKSKYYLEGNVSSNLMEAAVLLLSVFIKSGNDIKKLM